MKNTLVLFLAGVLLVLLVSASCSLGKRGKSEMERMQTSLKDHGIDRFVFTNEQENTMLVVPAFGGRIIAASIGRENLFWTHPDVLKGQGGQRSWISPEGGPKGFLFKPDWSGSRNYSMMDPGNYSVVLHEENSRLVLENTFQVTSNDGLEEYDLTLKRDIRSLADPLQKKSEEGNLSYQYLGIDFMHQLRNNSSRPIEKLLALWCLIQVPPKGTMIVPVKTVEDGAWRGNYFEPTPAEYAAVNIDSYSFFLHGSQRYKIGFPPRSIEGVICYLRKGAGSGSSLIIMTFPFKSDAFYPDRPKEEKDSNGDAIQIYSHLEEGDRAFGELECHSWALDLPPGTKEAFPIRIMMYKASLDVLKKIGRELVCEGFGSARLF